MLKKSLRLTTKELENVLKNGVFFHSGSLTLRFIVNQKDVKYAVVTPQKTFKTAVKRHEVKRQVYDLIKPLISRTKNGTHAILFIKDIKFIERQDRQSEIEDFLKKAQIIV